MTDQVTTQPSVSGEAQQFLQCWMDGLVKVLDQIAGSAFAAELMVPPEDLPAPTEKDLSLLVVCAGAVRGEMLFRLPAATAAGFAQLLLGETLDPATEPKQEHREAAEELIRQVAGQVATALRSRWGEVQLRVDAGGTTAWADAAQGWMSLKSATTLLGLEYRLSAALVAGLRPQVAAVAAKETAPDNTLELLMDVELEATLRFGGRQMRLREILELDAGSVVELDRQVQQAADLFLDGKLIARGEVVVVEGNYGLRVTEVTALAAASGRRS